MMSDHHKLDADFMTAVATRLAGRHWPITVLEQLTQGAGRGLVSAIDDLVVALQRLGEEDFADVAPAERSLRETGQ